MTAAYFEDHPTDPEKMIMRKPRLDQGPDYERGFVDGMQYQMHSSVDKAVNRMAQPERHELQAKGEHPAPCARHCEATAFRIVIKNLESKLAQPEQEPPKYSFKAHWEKDGRIGVVGAVVRPDGGVHLLQDFIDPPQQEPVQQCKACFGMGFVDGKGDQCLTCNGTGEQSPQRTEEKNT